MQDYVNRTRHYRSLDPGEVVFRRHPGPARLPRAALPGAKHRALCGGAHADGLQRRPRHSAGRA
eukprot:15350889-Alexandrium_andersonii.AAC.1